MQTNSDLHCRLSAALEENMQLRRLSLHTGEHAAVASHVIPNDLTGFEQYDDCEAERFRGQLGAKLLALPQNIELTWSTESLPKRPPSPEHAPNQVEKSNFENIGKGKQNSLVNTVPTYQGGRRDENKKVPLMTKVRIKKKQSKEEQHPGLSAADSTERQEIDDDGVNIENALLRANEIFRRHKLQLATETELIERDRLTTEQIERDRLRVDIITRAEDDEVHSDRNVLNEGARECEHAFASSSAGCINTQDMFKEEMPATFCSNQEAAADDKKRIKKAKKTKLLWQECVDNDSGNTYFYNRKTRETTWDRPSENELQIKFSRN